jgi:phosphate:Na+ symporter|uniref:Na/Pi cotransporter family protein n=1 Tax=Cephaloticoccus sp. TaxID=1985742 RepID=UPI0040493032
MIGTTLTILGSLGLFLFGMKVMSEALQKLSGERLRGMMRKMTSNRFMGLGTGFGVTCLVQSSSATTVMIVSFVNASLLTVTEAIGMIMGANLGTTTTFWIVSFLGFKFSISSIALPMIGLALPLIFSRQAKLRDTGEFIMGFGILFLGLMFLKDSVPDIRNSPEVLTFVQGYTGRGLISVLFFFAFGTILTVIVQSSSVAGAITLTMAYKGWIDYPSACAIILGENVGTTITANIAAMGGNTNAKRAALAHLVFNLIGVIWAIALFKYFANFVDMVMPGDALEKSNIPLHLAAFHSLFNLINICLLIGFVPQLGRLVERLISDRKGKAADHVSRGASFLPQTGELNIAEAERDVQRMGQLTRDLMTGFVELFLNEDKDLGERVKELKKLEEESDRLAYETTSYLLECSAQGISDTSMLKVTAMLRVVAELEDICDCGYRLVMLAERKYRKRRALPPETIKQVEQFAKIVLQFMDFYSSRIVRGVEMQDMETAYQLENTIDRFRKSLRRESLARMSSSGETVKAEMIYIDMLNNMESIGNHSLNVLQALRHRD